MRWMQACALATGSLLASSLAHADTWLPPCPEAFVSANQQWRLVVVPGGSGSFKHCRPEQVRLAMGHTRSRDKAQGTLQHLNQDRWLPAWQAWLIDESPGQVVVSDNGRVATAGQRGRSASEIVLYDPKGRTIRSLALTDFLPKPYVHVLPHSVSAINWGGLQGFSADGERLLLRVRVPTLDDEAAALESPEYVELALDARTGAALPPQGAAWARALQIANRADDIRCAAEKRELDKYMTKLSPASRAEEARRYDADGRDAMGACGPLVDMSEPETKAAE